MSQAATCQAGGDGHGSSSDGRSPALSAAAAGAWCTQEWYQARGPATAAGLGAVYVAAMGGSHPLAKRIGAWPSVAVVTAVTMAAAEVVTRTTER